MFKFSNLPINKLTFGSPNYPNSLKKLKDPPKILYYRGVWDPKLFEKSLAVVGSRRMTRYGEQAIENLLPFLVAEGVTIISGFMYGIDTKAHQECLDCGGKTIAVLGGGLDVLYPPENEKLYLDIITANGLIISEYEPEQQPQLWTFPKRNRIVAGLSTLGVLVIEAGEKSGSLITAKIARKLKRPSFAVPGPITSSACAGTNKLIKEGLAKMVLNSTDIVGAYHDTPVITPDNMRAIHESPLQNKLNMEQQILSLLSAEPLTTDEIAFKLAKNIIEISQILTLMAIKNNVQEKNGKYYPQSGLTI